MPKERYNEIWNADELNQRIGRYFVDFTQWLLAAHQGKSKELFHNDPTGDLIHWGMRSMIEVKGRSNRDAFIVHTDQLDNHLRDVNIGFPVNQCSFAFCSYRNQSTRTSVGTNSQRLLSRCAKTQCRLETFLARNTTVVYFVDISIVDRIRDVVGTVQESRNRCTPRSLVMIPRSILRQCADDTRGTFAEWGFEKSLSQFLPPQARTIRPITVETRFRQREHHLTVVPIVPLGQRQLLKKFLNGTVVRQ